MSRTIDGPLDDYEPYSPFDLGPLDGEPEQPDDDDSEEQSLPQGTKVRCNGYDGVIVRHYHGAMYEIRVPGGVTCTDDFTVTEKEAA